LLFLFLLRVISHHTQTQSSSLKFSNMEKKELILHSNYRNRAFGIDIRYQDTAENKPVVIFVHGFKGFKDWGTFNTIADYFAQAGFVFIKMNFSHNGTTPQTPLDFVDLDAFGSNNFSIEADDVSEVLRHLNGRPILPGADLSRVAIIGHSRGGIISVAKTFEDERLKAGVTWAGVLNVKGWIPEDRIEHWRDKGVLFFYNGRTQQNMPMYFQFYEDTIKNFDRFDIENVAQKLEKPFLVCHGTGDVVVPASQAEQFKKWKPDAELFLVEGGDHTFNGTHPFEETELPTDLQKVVDKTISFLKENL